MLISRPLEHTTQAVLQYLKNKTNDGGLAIIKGTREINKSFFYASLESMIMRSRISNGNM